jgi:hypothetical protein
MDMNGKLVKAPKIPTEGVGEVHFSSFWAKFAYEPTLCQGIVRTLNATPHLPHQCVNLVPVQFAMEEDGSKFGVPLQLQMVQPPSPDSGVHNFLNLEMVLTHNVSVCIQHCSCIKAQALCDEWKQMHTGNLDFLLLLYKDFKTALKQSVHATRNASSDVFSATIRFTSTKLSQHGSVINVR